MGKCLEWGQRREKKCTEYRDDGYDSCKEYRDDGYSSCDRWSEDCCDWWPCSWGCEIISWICVAWIWISNIVCVVWEWIKNVVCVAWTWVTTGICIAADVIVAVAGVIVETFESILGWVLSAVAFVIEILLSIPYVGRVIAWILAAFQTIVWLVFGIIDTIAGFLGIRPEKKLRVCTIVLADENGAPIVLAATVVPWLQKAADVYRQEANVRIVPVAPFHYRTGFADDETVTEDWIHVLTDASSKNLLDLGGEAATLGDDLTHIGADYNRIACTECFYGTWRKVIGYGAPITVFVIRSLEEGTARSLGPLTDYVLIGGKQNIDVTTVAHEMGHTCYLWHNGDNDNLMFGSSPRGTSIEWWQVTLLRSSRHVTYF
jgi:hypothetical protein